VLRIPLLAIALTVLGAPVATLAQNEQPFSSLEERMTGEEFEAAGLDKLTPSELRALNQWIRARSLATRDAPARATAAEALPDRPGTVPPKERMAREPFQSRIVGTFGGWSGDTEFELENGMVWRQAERARFRMQPVENPVVYLKPGFGGSWRLSVEGHNRSVRVERIE
jgi:hypothetical protein